MSLTTSAAGHLRHCKQAEANCSFRIQEQPFRPGPIGGNPRAAFDPQPLLFDPFPVNGPGEKKGPAVPLPGGPPRCELLHRHGHRHPWLYRAEILPSRQVGRNRPRLEIPRLRNHSCGEGRGIAASPNVYKRHHRPENPRGVWGADSPPGDAPVSTRDVLVAASKPVPCVVACHHGGAVAASSLFQPRISISESP